ncbi:MAG: hypothetical protein HQL47_02515 [Gammaproteobacteria bacterium]|nr:hypothetical protein [Gammaproteobacteria bacterium]
MIWPSLPLLWLLTSAAANAAGFLDRDGIKPWVDQPKVDNFALCFNHSCKETAVVGLRPAQWAQVERLFKPPAASAEAERARIGQAIALLERLVAPLIGTQNDKAMNFQGSLAQGNQQDCIDESTNTSTFLNLIQQQGLLRFHRLQATSTRGWFIMGMPHTTAVIRETRSGIDYAVDSWFHDNGKPPEILPVSQWRKGWHPAESP